MQQLIAGRPATAAFPRLFQFGMRAGMRSWATGQAWWQGPEGPYWGHNAVVRIAPFREHCRLQPLPDGSPILSHDQVEAVRLHAAGWKVCCLPDETGSLEGNPPALPEFLARDLRWAAGNMQYGALLFLPGTTWMGRWQLAQAILLFLGTPLWVGVLAAAALNAATGGGAATAGRRAAGVDARHLGRAARAQAARLCGGAAQAGARRALRRARGVPARRGRGDRFHHAARPGQHLQQGDVPAGLALRRRGGGGWAPQNRADRGIGWGDAARLLWPHTLFGAAVFGLLLATAPGAALWALPVAGGLLGAIPFCVLSASPRVSALLRRWAVAATPEELAGSGTAGVATRDTHAAAPAEAEA